eukprot:UN13257
MNDDMKIEDIGQLMEDNAEALECAKKLMIYYLRITSGR